MRCINVKLQPATAQHWTGVLEHYRWDGELHWTGVLKHYRWDGELHWTGVLQHYRWDGELHWTGVLEHYRWDGELHWTGVLKHYRRDGELHWTGVLSRALQVRWRTTLDRCDCATVWVVCALTVISDHTNCQSTTQNITTNWQSISAVPTKYFYINI